MIRGSDGGAGAETDLNVLIPAFMAANEERRRRALVVLRAGSDVACAVEERDRSPERFLNQVELAKHLAVHPTTVRRWEIPCHRLGRVPRYKLSEVEAYLASPEFGRLQGELKLKRAG